MRKIFLGILSIILWIPISLAQDGAVVRGQVESAGKYLPFVNVFLKGTNIGDATDEKGRFELNAVPAGQHILQVRAVGYKSESKTIEVAENAPAEFQIELEPDVLELDQVVVSANRNEISRMEAPVIVNAISPGSISGTQSANITESLNFLPGLRTENNCQNCGFTQLRMNGMDGAYSQILINGRPIFSGLAGVYGLELLPNAMIERLEVVRGGGSALYGGNAIAGTVNVITKDPAENTYCVKYTQRLTGIGIHDLSSPAPDNLLNFKTSLVSDNTKNGIVLYGFYRKRQPVDVNADAFSELSKINNITLGTRLFQRMGKRSKITADLFHIDADRRGGNLLDRPLHEADIAESVAHKISSGALSFDKFFRENDLLSLYLSGQYIDRDSYYGAEQALDAYGHTLDLTWVGGMQYTARTSAGTILTGAEYKSGSLMDEKLGYPEYDSQGNVEHIPNATVADQLKNTVGSFLQYEFSKAWFHATAGLRYDHYLIMDGREESEDVSGDVISPRLNLMTDINEHVQFRLGYSQGYRAPQIFDEDLHIETSGARQVIHENADDLNQETSHSLISSVNFHMQGKNHAVEFLVEGFLTRLIDPFTNEIGMPDNNGQVVYTRVNANGYAQVAGINMELKYAMQDKISFNSGFTVQESCYSEAQEFGEKRFFRAPNNYGYATFQYDISRAWRISLTENYTGKMLVPYFGPEIANPEEGELRESDIFFDTGVKLCYHLPFDKTKMTVFAGMKNIFNAYQEDLDVGIDRDPAYIYGPLAPRTLYFGLRIGNFRH